MKVVNKSVSDSTRRRRNIVISGLHESEPGEASSETEAASVTDLCKSVLYSDIHSSIVSLKRIGKNVGHRPRKLLVTLNSETLAQDLLSRAKLLRNSSDDYVASSIFINRDLSPEESKVAYE